MPDYKCKVIPLVKIIPGFKPLCDRCTCRDCDNPLEKKTVSILGVNKKMKVFAMGTSVGIVASCEGFIEK